MTTQCEVCKQPITEGYLVDDHFAYCNEEHLMQELTREDAEDDDYCFWTTFD